MNTTVTTALVQSSRAPTAMQWAVLGFMYAFYLQEDRLPTCPDICAHFGWSSVNAAYQHISYLAAKGFIEKRGAHLRFARTEKGREALEKLAAKEQGEPSTLTPADLETA